MEMRASDQTTSQDSQGAAATGSQTQGADSAWPVVPLMPNQGHRDEILLLSSQWVCWWAPKVTPLFVSEYSRLR